MCVCERERERGVKRKRENEKRDRLIFTCTHVHHILCVHIILMYLWLPACYRTKLSKSGGQEGGVEEGGA